MWTEFKNFLNKNFGIELNDEKISRFKKYLNEILVCSKRFNLTKIKDTKEILYLHFADSLAGSVFLRNSILKGQNISVIDIGSGAGFPGIPLKIVFPEIEIFLIESNKKKYLFLDYVKNQLKLKNTEIICDRAEEISKNVRFKNRFDFALLRAVKKFPDGLFLTEPFLKKEGMSLFWTTELQENKKIILDDYFKYTLPGLEKERYILAARLISHKKQ
ncbi:MAG: 16S rRNA (guanine(527)-N(7))-methyltransferase RsmG [Endomicrobiia bacterium]